jgi:predicted Zn-dependent protease
MLDAIEACRRGRWNEGLPLLARIAEEDERTAVLPALVYSYLGYGIALKQQRVQEGLKLCQHAIKLEFYQPESYLNLARTLLLAGNRRAAVKAIREGLHLDAENPALREVLEEELGERRTPVLGFLSRGNPINSLLGRIRHTLRR